MYTASILVPYHPDGGHRDLAWNWNRRRIELFFPEYPVYIGDSMGIHGFQRTAAANAAASQSNSDVYIFVDCDTTTDSEWVKEAVEQVGSGEIPWALYNYCHYLDKESTDRVLESDPISAISSYKTDYQNSGISFGGVIVLPRQAFEEVGGYDERFTVWGAHDSCFAMAMSLLWGNPVRFDSTIYHLWHPTLPIKQLFGHPAQHQQQLLTARYTQAFVRGKDAIREVRFGNKTNS